MNEADVLRLTDNNQKQTEFTNITINSISVDGEIEYEKKEKEGGQKVAKIVTGYKDKGISINIEILPKGNSIQSSGEEEDFYVDDSIDEYDWDTLENLEKLFCKNKNGIPKTFNITSEHLKRRGITDLLFVKLSSSEDSEEKGVLNVSLNFVEYEPAVYDIIDKKDDISTSDTTVSGTEKKKDELGDEFIKNRIEGNNTITSTFGN